MDKEPHFSVAITVNGALVAAEVPARESLADFLRHRVGLTGTHVGCEQGICGACTVRFDGRTARSCLTLAAQAHGHSIETIEGVTDSGEIADLQDAFLRHKRRAVRVLHPRHADHRGGVFELRQNCREGVDPGVPFGQLLPLYRLPCDRRCDCRDRREESRCLILI